MKTGDGTARSFEFTLITGSEHDGWTMMRLAQPTRHNADDALMPGRISHNDALLFRGKCARDQLTGLLAHAGFDTFTLAIQAIKFVGNFGGANGIIGGQAFDAERDVVQSPRRIHARPEHETEVVCRGFFHVTLGDREQRRDAHVGQPIAHTTQARFDQSTIDRI